MTSSTSTRQNKQERHQVGDGTIVAGNRQQRLCRPSGAGNYLAPASTKIPLLTELSDITMSLLLSFGALKAALKRPHSKRCRDCRTLTNFAERLDCGEFTAAFERVRNTRA
jgi:hypothetical protein